MYDGGANLYEYVEGRPTLFVDPDGTQVAIVLVDNPVGIAVGGAFGIYCLFNPQCVTTLSNVCQDVADYFRPMFAQGGDGVGELSRRGMVLDGCPVD